LREELGITTAVDMKYLWVFRNEEKSKTFNILTEYHLHFYRIFFNDQQYNSEGYIEKGEDKDTYFVWEPLP
jgi:intein-encoded DNA endonuclease-like protein